MSFYLRKSLKFGPIRFNLSKSGIGVSAGIKGLRVGTGPRGNYIHAGRGGIYYRKTFGTRSPHLQNQLASIPPLAPQDLPELSIEPNSIGLTDADSAELVIELNQKRRRKLFWPFLAFVSVIVICILIWNDVAPIWTVAAAVSLLLLCVGTGIRDHRRKTAVLFFNLEPAVLSAYEALHVALEQMRGCGRVSRIESTEYYADRKYHSGVLQGVERSAAQPILRTPPLVRTNIPVFAIPAGMRTLYFFPDRIWVYETKAIGAISYSSLNVAIGNCRFVESEGVPADSQVVGSTWKYVNKDGGPDRRFRDNRALPIVLYEELHFQTQSGLNEILQISKAGIGTNVAEALGRLKRVLTTPEADVAKIVPSTAEWVKLGEDGATFHVASARNENFFRKLLSVIEEPFSQGKAETAQLIEAMIDTILIDWRGLTHDGTSFDYSVENARIVLTQSEIIRQCISSNALRIAGLDISGAGGFECLTQFVKEILCREDEELVEKCLEIIRQEKRASTSLLQRRLRLGYTRAARIVDILEQRGILGPGEGAKPREILVDLDATV